MTFFVTSTGSGALGGNLSGLAGADAKCTTLAAAAGGGDHTWAAYLSTNAADAKDRIGAGPWKNQKGKELAANLAALHAVAFNMAQADILDETGAVVPLAQHDILTGSNKDGTKINNANCAGWTSNTSNNGAQVGHTDSITTGQPTDFWNSAHSNGNAPAGGNNACSAAQIAGQNGAGRVYCFATN